MGDEESIPTKGEQPEEAAPGRADQPHGEGGAAPPEAEGSAPEGEDSIEALKRELQAAREQAEGNWNEALRAKAEAENVRKRAERDLDKARRYALEKFAEELLPVKDSLELALAAVDDGKATVEKFREGTELTLKMLGQVFERFGIEEVEPRGEKFDPERHEAMSMQESSEQPPNTVLTVYQKGYMLNDRLLRPAMVTVAKVPDGAGEESQGGESDAEG